MKNYWLSLIDKREIFDEIDEKMDNLSLNSLEHSTTSSDTSSNSSIEDAVDISFNQLIPAVSSMISSDVNVHTTATVSKILCSHVLKNGMPCQYKAKYGDVCGIHKN